MADTPEVATSTTSRPGDSTPLETKRHASARKRTTRVTPPKKAMQPQFDTPALPPIDGIADLCDPLLYINREINWIDFDRKVLDEACDPEVPLLEQLKFLSIFYNNLDEFFMVRVANLCRQYQSGALSTSPDKMPPAKQLAEIRRRVLMLLNRAQTHWRTTLLPALRDKDINIVRYRDLTPRQKSFLQGYFDNEIYPILTPQAIDPGHPFPVISNTSLNFIVRLKSPEGLTLFARLKCPNNMGRFIFVPRNREGSTYKDLGFNSTARDEDVILSEDLIREHLERLFPGHEVTAASLFRITRNTDMEIEEDEADDLLEAVRDFVDQRRFGAVTRLEIEHGTSTELSSFLVEQLGVAPFQIYRVKGPLAISEFMPLAFLDRPSLQDEPYKGLMPAVFTQGDIFTHIAQKDLFLYHPYESFGAVLEFIRQACEDPHVVAIKQTLYRCGNNSPIVQALINARRRGKQVTAVVELKARFDEERNITWAEELEKAGVNVVYGFVGLKIHAKLCLVIRREPEGMRRYCHISSGNYNAQSAKIYTDFGLLSAHKEICADVSDLFNVMTGYSTQTSYNRLIVSPHSTRQTILSHIEEEIAIHREKGGAEIIFKCNQLVDRHVIRALYEASQAGVKIQLQVRGICCLRPGVKGVSDNITVTSIVGRFLEHSRVYWFAHGGNPIALIGSADMMARNLDGRIEVLVPILDTEIRARLKGILDLHLRDNVQCWELGVDGRYTRRSPSKTNPALDTQTLMAKHHGQLSY